MPTKGTHCPLMNKKCIEHKCALYTCVRGTDCNTGQEVDSWGCALGWMPMLMINTAHEARKGAAATESFRNEVVKQNDKLIQNSSEQLIQQLEHHNG